MDKGYSMEAELLFGDCVAPVVLLPKVLWMEEQWRSQLSLYLLRVVCFPV